jgi:hypothetical protein
MWLSLMVIVLVVGVLARHALEVRRAQPDDHGREAFYNYVRAAALIDQMGDEVERGVFAEQRSAA